MSIQNSKWMSALRGQYVLLVVLAALAGFASVASFWGLPDGATALSSEHWAIDTIGPVSPLAEANQRFTRAGIDNAVYPLFHYMVLAAAYVPYLAVAWLTGGLSDPSSEFPYGVIEPAEFFRTLALIGSLVSLLMAFGIVLIVYDVTRRLFDVRAARWAAAFTALLAPLTYYAGTTNLDVPYLFWTLLAMRALLLGATDGRLRHFVVCGVAAGLGMATKDQAVGYFVLWPLLIPILVARLGPESGTHRLWRALIDRRTLAAAVAMLLAYAIGNNLFLGGWQGWLRHFEFLDAFYQANLAPDARPFVVKQADLLAMATQETLQMVGPLTALLGILGLWLAIRTRRWMSLMLPAFALSYYATIIMPVMVHARYLLGMLILLMPFAGYAVSAGWSSRSVVWRNVVRVTAVAAVAVEALLSLHLAYTLGGDSRYAMASWVRANVPEYSAIESQTQPRYLPRLADRYDYTTVGNSFHAVSYHLVGDELSAAALAARAPDFVMVLESSGLSGDPERTSDPQLREYFRGLLSGEMGYEVVARFATPSYLRFLQITAGTRPTTVLLRRSSDSGSATALAGPSPP